MDRFTKRFDRLVNEKKPVLRTRKDIPPIEQIKGTNLDPYQIFGDRKITAQTQTERKTSTFQVLEVLGDGKFLIAPILVDVEYPGSWRREGKSFEVDYSDGREVIRRLDLENPIKY